MPERRPELQLHDDRRRAVGDFKLDDDGDDTLSNTKIFELVPPGTYTVTEAATTGWELTGSSCSRYDRDGQP